MIMSTAPDYTKEDKLQQRCEAYYLCLLLLLAASALHCIYFKWQPQAFDKRYVYTLLGGFFGGWVLDVKWFYRVTARGKNNQHSHKWEAHKVYWRLFVPFVSAVVAFAFYALASSGFLQVLTVDGMSGSGAFGVGFLSGYFSDGTIAKMSELVDCLWGRGQMEKGSKNET